tara:strand:- start:189 stop:1064 length:876 start_codon:yes stop_codon:yes gene_type:complete
MKSMIQRTSIETLFERMHVQADEIDYFITDDISSLLTYDTIRPDHYSIAYCFEGNYEVELSFQKYNLTPGNLMFFKPGEIHHLIAAHNYKGFLVTFSKHFFLTKTNWIPEVITQPFFMEGSNSLMELKQEDQDKLDFYFKALLLKNKEQYNSNKKKIIRTLIAGLLFEINALYPKANKKEEHNKSRYKTVVRNFKELLQAQFMKEKEVSYYADKLHVTSGHLSDILRTETGKSAKEHIQDKIILEAKVLLQGSHLSIGEIAQMFQFTNDSSFIRFFKNKTGLTPAKYRLSR